MTTNDFHKLDRVRRQLDRLADARTNEEWSSMDQQGYEQLLERERVLLAVRG